MDFRIGDEVVEVNFGWVGTVKAIEYIGAPLYNDIVRVNFSQVSLYRHPQDIKLTKKSIINRFFNEDKMQD